MDTGKEAFREEAYELLAELETALLELEKTPEDLDVVAQVFRAMHTIKGSGAMFGFDDVAAFTHDIETAYDMVRNDRLAVTGNLVNLTLSACDQIRRMVDGESGQDGDSEKESVAEGFRKLISDREQEDSHEKSREQENRQEMLHDITSIYRIRFSPFGDIFSTGFNPSAILDDLRNLGECRIISHTKNIPELENLNPEECYMSWDIIITTRYDINAIRDVFIFIENQCELKIDLIDRDDFLEDDVEYKKLGEILVDRGDVTSEIIEKTVSLQKHIGELLVETGSTGHDRIEAALAEQQLVRDSRKERMARDQAATIRVPAEKLDSLMNMVGELVTLQSRLTQASTSSGITELIQIAEEVERLTSGLRDNTMSIRMMPIGSTFSRFNRLVRDLSIELGKDVILTTDGAETELDKTVLERINDPMIHLIRNSIDHGIESPGERESAGKPGSGTIHLSAVHSGAHVLIHISDDGAGLDSEAIRNKAIEKGLVHTDSVLSEKELFSLIFAPGFSTAQKVTNLSGRGVGMDVVKRNIEALQGSIEISSRTGKGTTITLKLPLTLAIIDGLLVKIGATYFVLPLAAIEECIELTRTDAEKTHGQHFADIRGEIVPYICLRERFRIEEDRPDIEQIAITRFDNTRVGLVIDQVVGEHQTVIKQLGRMFRDVEEISGATILGDGTVALILDLSKLINRTETEEKLAKAG